MDHDFAPPPPPEMQPHRAPGPRSSFSRGHMLGRHTHQKLTRDVSPLIPVIKKTVHLNAFPQGNVLQTFSQPSLRSRAWSMSQQGSLGPLGSLPPNSFMPRKLSSISLTIRQNVQARPLDAPLSHWEELSNLGKEVLTHGEGRLSTSKSPPMAPMPKDRTSSEGHGNPDPTKASRTPSGDKPLVSSHLTLPFQSQNTQSSGPVAQVQTRTSPGRGKSKPRGIPRSRAYLQRATASPSTNLSAVGTKLDIARNLGTMAINRPELAINMSTPNPSRMVRDTELPILGAKMGMTVDLPIASKAGKATDSVIAGPPKLGTAMTLAGAGTTKPGQVLNLVTADSDKLENVMAMTTEDSAMALEIPDQIDLGITRLDTAMGLAGVNIAELDTTADSSVLDTSQLETAMDSVVLVCPVSGETKLDIVNHLTITDAATYSLTTNRSTDPGQDYAAVDAVTDSVTEPTSLDLAREPKGQSGLGKSTLVNTLFKSQVSRKASSWNREEKIPKTVEIKAIGHVIEEGGVKMKLTVIDTPGFGDQINNENCWEPIEKYINEQYEKFLKEEVNIARKKRIPDTRVHCCLYFISPTGHSLRPLDLEFMKHLSKVVNIIPVIAKADTMTLEEKSEFKQRVRKELEVNGIEFYPQKEFDEDLEDKTENDKIRQESMPFAVVGSDKEYQVNGKRVLGRKTPWGIIEVENLNHCEFALLRDFVIRTHLQDLKEVTHNIHYETYRAKRLNDNGGLPPGEGLLGTALPPVPATPCPSAE
ncbi:neuronal-specific septin-3 isoform X4 [Arvicola amphibius]|uniref:neuronal-specific septin-3 isoform X4 n=1 Tax=Arvicola amphibius TaxID=1047088 RepID=UPI001C098428|nr:neuronal-specific septin-3 isoform X4 [Arvicola amphibius]